MEERKKEKIRWGTLIFMVFIIIGLTSSFVFFGFSGSSQKVKHNGISFVNNGNVWIAKIDGRHAAFSFLPSEVEDISAFEDFHSRLQGKFEIDVTSDFNSSFNESIALAQHQMGLTLAQYNVFVRQGFTANNTFNRPVITCDDSTSSVPVVYFRYGNVSSISLDGDCIIAEAPTHADFIRVKDRLLYGLFGVVI